MLSARRSKLKFTNDDIRQKQQENENDQMASIMEIVGVPPRSLIAKATRRKVFFDDDYNPIITPNSRGKIRMPGNKNLYGLMSCSDKDFVDFIDVSNYNICLI